METEVLAQIVTCRDWCGTAVVVASMVLFPGTVWLLTAAIFGNRMGYLISATGFFAFMIILSALWVFGAPGTPKYLGPKGELPTWLPLAAGQQLESHQLPVVQKYPGAPWETPKAAGMEGEVEAASIAFQEFLAEEATHELEQQGIEGVVESTEFQIESLRFAELDERPLAMAQGFAIDGGPQVLVVGYKDPGNEPLPSYLFFIGSLIGFGVHLPFLDRAERTRKELLTGGDQPPFRGPA